MSYELRPLSLAEILDAAFRLVQTEWKTLIGLSFIVQAPMMVIALAMPSMFDPFSGALDPGGEMSEDMLMLAGLGFVGMILAYVFLFPFVSAAVSSAVGHFYLGRPYSAKEAARAGGRVYFKLMGSYFMYMVAVLGATVALGMTGVLLFAGGGVLLGLLGGAESTLAAAVGGILGVTAFVALLLAFMFVGCIASLLPPIVALESQGMVGAVSRAFSLGSTARLRLVGIVLSAGLIVGFPVGGSQMLVGSIPVLGTIIWSIFQAIGFAFTTSVMVVLYFDFRCRAENYDLELLAAQVEAGAGLDHR